MSLQERLLAAVAAKALEVFSAASHTRTNVRHTRISLSVLPLLCLFPVPRPSCPPGIQGLSTVSPLHAGPNPVRLGCTFAFRLLTP